MRGRGLKHKTNWAHWPAFEIHHYLKPNPMPAAHCYLGTVENQPVAHCAVTTFFAGKKKLEARLARLVVMPEWQGIGIGHRFLNTVAQMQLEGSEGARLPGRKLTTLLHTSHPGLVRALTNDPAWQTVSRKLHGARKKRSRAAVKTSARTTRRAGGFGGHFRPITGFRYIGRAA